MTDERADSGFNINDNTPLFIWAAWHHYLTTKDEDFLQRIYPAVWKAGQCILRARDTELDEIPAERKHGLITCTVRGVETLGIASWRNIIPNYTLNGAVTEINAECAYALRCAAKMAEARGTPESQQDANVFSEAGEALTAALNTHLINPETGFYYLNIDLDGNIHTDVTADEIYPVMFEVAPDEVAYRIVTRLNLPDFWTPAGIRKEEICRFVYGTPPEGSEYLVIGHEGLGEVMEIGSAVSTVKVGDLVVPSVRRPCPDERCAACRAGWQDFCTTGDFTERGIKEQHGFLTEFVVEEEHYLHIVPSELRGCRGTGLAAPSTISASVEAYAWRSLSVFAPDFFCQPRLLSRGAPAPEPIAHP